MVFQRNTPHLIIFRSRLKNSHPHLASIGLQKICIHLLLAFQQLQSFFYIISFLKKRESRKWLALIYNNHSLLYQLFMTSNKRILIFDSWQIQEPSLESQPSSRDSQKLLFGQDLILETQRLISNIDEFLKSKKGYQESIEKIKDTVRDLLNTLHKDCNCKAEEQQVVRRNLEHYNASLCNLYLCLRKAKHLQRCLTCYFQTANLANYDRQATQLSFTEPASDMQTRLKQAVKALKEGMHRLMQAQKLKQSQKVLSSIFGKDYTPAFALQRLQELMAHDNIVKIHFLMVCQLEILQGIADDFTQFLAVSQSEYLKHELILDSIKLMQAQIKEMSDQSMKAEEELKNACNSPKEVNPQVLVSQHEKRRQVWHGNIHIYQINLQNFTRVNVETDMFYYTELKGNFVEKLDCFISNTTNYHNNHASLLFLLDRQTLLTDISRRLALVGKVSEPDRRLALTIYNETSLHALPQEGGDLGKFKNKLLDQMEQLMNKNGIAYNKRAREQVTLERDILHHQTIIHQIEDAPISQQYALTTSLNSTIKASEFQVERILSNQKLNESSIANSYRLALQYANVMGQQINTKDKLKKFQNIRKKKGYEDLPVRFQAIVLNYINDIRIIEESREALKPLLKTAKEQAFSHIKQKLKNSQQNNIDGLMEKELQKFKEYWFKLHDKYLRRVSAYGEELVMDHLQQECLSIINELKDLLEKKDILEKKNVVDHKKMDVDRKLFFSHRVLNELVKLANSCLLDTLNSLKIVNINQTFEEVFRLLDNGFISKPIGGKLSDIIKLSLLEKYLQIVQGCGNLWRAVRVLRRIAYLQSASQLYSSFDQSKEALLQALLRIQLQMNEVALTLKVQDQHRAFLNERVPPLIKEMRKFPLTLAAKHDISGFVALWRYPEIINELRDSANNFQIFDSSQSTKLSDFIIVKVACIFVGVSQLKDARKAAEGTYDAYENAIVKEKKNIEEYFGRTAVAFRGKIQAKYLYLEQATKAFLNSHEIVKLNQAAQSLCDKA